MKTAQKNTVNVIPTLKQVQGKLAGIQKNQSGSQIESGMTNRNGFTSLTFVTVLGLFLAVVLALIGTGAVKIPGSRGIPVSPIPVSDPVEDDEACNDPYNADCERLNDPEDLTPEQIQQALEGD